MYYGDTGGASANEQQQVARNAAASFLWAAAVFARRQAEREAVEQATVECDEKAVVATTQPLKESGER